MASALAGILRLISRNLGGEYGACVHLNAANAWVLRPNSTDRATAWQLGAPFDHEAPSAWLLLTHPEPPSVRIIGSSSLSQGVLDAWAELQRLGNDLPAQGVTKACVRNVKKQLLRLLALSGNSRTQWTKSELEAGAACLAVNHEAGAHHQARAARAECKA